MIGFNHYKYQAVFQNFCPNKGWEICRFQWKIGFEGLTDWKRFQSNVLRMIFYSCRKIEI